MIELLNVTSGYDRKMVVHNINTVFEEGKVTSIIGKNGCGKSTLLKTASRLINPIEGNVLINGKSIFDFSPKEFAKLVSFLPQVRKVSAITAESLVMHGRFPYLGFLRRASKEDVEIVNEAMNLVGIYDYKDKMLSSLSGGELQKVYLSMVLAQDTPIIFMDEPTTYLDINHQFEIIRLIDKLRMIGKTVVAVMHDLSQALSISDKICLMEKGEIVLCDTPEAVFNSKEIDRVFNVHSELIYSENGKAHYIFN